MPQQTLRIASDKVLVVVQSGQIGRKGVARVIGGVRRVRTRQGKVLRLRLPGESIDKPG